MSRIECPSCGKSHNLASLALACRSAKAAQIAGQPSRTLLDVARTRDPEASRTAVLSEASSRRSSARSTMREYVAQQTRDNAVGGTL